MTAPSPPTSVTRRVVQRATLALGLAGVAWSIVVWMQGGGTTTVLGLTVSTRSPFRPLYLGAIALTAFILSGGILRVPAGVGRVRRVLWSLGSRAARGTRPGHLALALSAAVVATGVTYGAAVAGGADSHGYLSQAQLWFEGRLMQPMPLMSQAPWPIADLGLAPLGYRPSLSRDALVPSYAPGLPMLMALAERVAGYCAIAWVVPVCGGLLVYLTFALGARLATPAVGAVAALLVAVSPAFGYMLMNPMSDLPVATAWALVFLLLLRASTPSSFGAGLAAAMALLIRPNLLPSLIAPGGYLCWRVLRAGPAERASAVKRLFAFGLALLPGVLFPLWFNWYLFGSPLKSGYGTLDTLFSVDHIVPNIHHYFWWVVESQTPVMLLGLVPLGMPLARFWRAGVDRGLVFAMGAFVLTVWAQYCYYADFDAWWYLRFLLPCWPFMMVGAVALGRQAVLTRHSWPRAVAAFVVGGVVLFSVVQIERRGILRLWQGEQRYLTAAREVRAATTRRSVIFSVQHSGSLRYYAGRPTIRYDNFEPDWLDRAVTWLTEHDIHPYLLAEAWEIDVFKQRFVGQQTLHRLDASPVFVYDGPFTIYLFDLAESARPNAPVRLVKELFDGPACVPPVVAPVLAVTQ